MIMQWIFTAERYAVVDPGEGVCGMWTRAKGDGFRAWASTPGGAFWFVVSLFLMNDP